MGRENTDPKGRIKGKTSAAWLYARASGVNMTLYRIYNSTGYDTGFAEYSGVFYLGSLSSGYYSIQYYSNDTAGNTENINNATVALVTPDINDHGRIDMTDIVTAIDAFGSFPGHPRWNPFADLNLDKKIDLEDIVMVLENFGKPYP